MKPYLREGKTSNNLSHKNFRYGLKHYFAIVLSEGI